MKAKEIREYIEEYTISETAKRIINCSKIINTDGFDIWSFKKLILLEYYIKPFLYIQENNNFKCVFIDLFSSCGASGEEDKKLVSIGSAIISILKGVIPNKKKGKNNRFYKWFFIDHNSDFCNALTSRISEAANIVKEETNEDLKLDKDISILCGDCNVEAEKVIQQLKKESEKEKIAVLVFIDPYTFTDIKWDLWKQLFSLKVVDIIFTFPIQTIQRGYKRCKELDKYLSPSMLGLLKSCKEIGQIPDKEFEKAYAEDISQIVNRTIHHYDLGISAKSFENREIYRISLFSHCGPAVKLTLNIATKLDKLKSNELKQITDQAMGKSKTLTDFFDKKKIDLNNQKT